MRHKIYGKHLGRNKDERDNLFKGLLTSLFTHGTIQTSEAKAKAIKGLIDKVVNFAKEKNTGRVGQFLTNRNVKIRLIKEIAPKMASRNSGYTSLVRVGTRPGDQTMMVRISLIGAEELKPVEKGIGSRVQGIVKTKEETKKVKAATPSLRAPKGRGNLSKKPAAKKKVTKTK